MSGVLCIYMYVGGAFRGGWGAASTCVAWCGKEGGETGGGTAADMFSAVALG